jgi:hypothetical protein
VLFLCYSGINGHAGHPQLQFAFFVPMGLLFLFRFFSRESFSSALFFGLSITLTFLTSVYYALFTLLVALLLWIGILLIRPNHFSWTKLARFPLGALLGILPLLPFVFPYLEVKEAFGSRKLYEAYYFSASGIGYFTASPFNFLYGGTAGQTHPEAHLFPGFVAYLLALVAVFRLFDASKLRYVLGVAIVSTVAAGICSQWPAWYLVTGLFSWLSLLCYGRGLHLLGKLERELHVHIFTNRDIIALLLFGAVACILVSFGPLGIPEENRWPVGPYTLVHLLPGFQGMRALGRLGFVAVLLIALLVSFGLIHLKRLVPAGRWFVLPIIALVALENYNNLLPLEPLQKPPSVFDTLAKQDPGAVVVLPFTGKLDKKGEVESWTDYSLLNVQYMIWGLPTGKPMVNGYSGLRSKMMYDYPRWTSSFPDERSIRALKRIGGLRYVVVMSTPAPSRAPDPPLDEAPPDLTLISKDGEGNYLFGWNDTQPIAQRVIFLPPRAGGEVRFELMLPPRPAPFSVTVVPVLGDEGGVELDPLSVSPNGIWTSYRLTIPQGVNRVAPVTLRFRSESVEPIMIRGVTPQ